MGCCHRHNQWEYTYTSCKVEQLPSNLNKGTTTTTTTTQIPLKSLSPPPIAQYHMLLLSILETVTTATITL